MSRSAPAGTSAAGPDLAGFAHEWAVAIGDTALVPLDWPGRVEFLSGLAVRLAGAMTARTFDATVGYQVGTELVAADFTDPDTLGATVVLLTGRLPAVLGGSGVRARRRLAELVGALSVGHARAVRDRALDGQEAVRRAAVEARARAEIALRVAQRQLLEASLHDPLTGLPNRAGLHERLARLGTVEDARTGQDARTAVCVIALDAFKGLTDSLGPRLGDRLLVTVAARLTAFALHAGCLLARLDGAEFALVVPGSAGPDEAAKAADRALSVLREPFHVDDHELRVRASVGVVHGLVDGDPVEVMRAAEIALHWAQADGGDRWALFDPDRNAAQVLRYQMSAALPGALSRGEFTLAYQPLVDLTSGRIAGLEALARWQHPTLGELPPDRFIGLAEDTGMIVALGLRLLEQACQHAARWQQSCRRPPYVSVNLAADQIRQVGLTADIAAVLERTGLRPNQLQLEITEGSAFEVAGETLATLRALADLGVRLAIDDFGTGYANHVYLRTLPVHGLKLDGTFVRSLRGKRIDARDVAIMTNLIDLGHVLDLTVTAEGVENAAQAQRLQEMGCDLGQGWHLGRPTSAERVGRMLARFQGGGRRTTRPLPRRHR